MSETLQAMSELEGKIQALEEEIMGKKKELAELRQQLPKRKIGEYTLLDQEGQEVRLTDLFGQHAELIMIHNMGRGCSYCTLWADGFNGVLQHLENKAAFVVSSPDAPAVQKEFASSRGWDFTMVSTEGSTFTKDMGFQLEDNSLYPGVSILTKEKGELFQVNKAFFGPGDDYCAVWHLFDLLPSGSTGWNPKRSYLNL